VARPHLVNLAGHTGASSSMLQLDGSDIVHTAGVRAEDHRAVSIGTLFPAVATSMGCCSPTSVPTTSRPCWSPRAVGCHPAATLSRRTRRRPGRDPRTRMGPFGRDVVGRYPVDRCAHLQPRGRTVAAMNATVHGGRNVDRALTGDYLPFLVDRSAVTEEWSNLSCLLSQRRPKPGPTAGTSGTAVVAVWSPASYCSSVQASAAAC
jgi:hypothetical protein